MKMLLWLLSTAALAAPSLRLTPVVTGLTKPVDAVALPGKTPELWILEQGGKIRSWREGKLGTVLDLESRVTSSCSECGLLGIALHPKFASNGRYFVNYTARRPELVTIVAELKRDGGAKEREVMRFRQPYSNHNGGGLAFGPDGYLYIGTGDGGAAGDPLGAGQDVKTVLAKMLRIDVDGAKPYGIPPDNPFSKGGGLKEIYAWGLRNPWRFSFDSKTGALFVGDVGQWEWEEVSLVEKGKNYGWNVTEGKHCFKPAKNCPAKGMEPPLVEYDHSQGNSVTGGYVYRGRKIPALEGVYVYGDYGSGTIWGLTYDQKARKVVKNEVLLESGRLISSFALDWDGEILVLDHKGTVLRLEVKSPKTGSG